ncbi:transcriptional regulator, Crp/Fnr family [Methylophaga frappieri]|uniref:Transcriptional regulator, Crp/Fnr family n=1 Tax=Methylophaga frappieri (strain ATCC BAA-2434 / DSM 25690 / JAM7) TaxID=754477 RepID=I1YJT7_METFJ|nr:Crp/Fnr family transcriptional regulator [Methylophaga frappieri]AFJ03180.1 transcriptional regulator, Crp/Fnr family [Methylophaga frappieri]
MNPAEPGCIAHQFQRFVDLSDDEVELLTSLEFAPKEYPEDAELIAAGSTAEKLYTLKSGWACAIRPLPDGQQQILDIFLPGQIIGLRELSFVKHQSEVRTLTDVVACPFPRRKLTEIFDAAPRLTDVFFLVMAREQSMLIERIINIGRRSAAESLAHFLVEIHSRLAIRHLGFTLPMTQSTIADTLSLSSVHISRTFKQLREMKLIDGHNGDIEIIDLEGLIAFSGFDRSYLEYHSEWAR